MINIISLKLLIYYLPLEIVYIIRTLSYKPQNKLLLEDIKNNIKTRNILIKSYNTDISWICSDLDLYLSETEFYTIVLRHYSINSTYDCNNYYQKLDDSYIKFNLYWGLMTIDERYKFINYQVEIELNEFY